MKKSLLLIIVIALTLGYSSCKDAVENTIDCSVESTFLSFNAEVDISNIRLIHFTFINGDTVGNRFNLDNAIKWDFGDGNSETTQGLEASHTYAAAGTYKVLANFTLHSGDASCTNYIEKTLSVD